MRSTVPSRGATVALVVLTGAAVVGGVGTGASASPFATRVLHYAPAPGSLVNNPAFNNPTHALGAPLGGGTAAPSNAKVVTLGGFGGSITLGFDQPVTNHPASPGNPLGLDLIVFGNAFFAGGDPAARFAEPGAIEVAADANANGLADDPWYLIRPPGAATWPAGEVPQASLFTQTWDDNAADPAFPPTVASWIPAGRTGQWTTYTYRLTDPALLGPVISAIDPSGERTWGLADCTPTMVLGDTDGDGEADDLNATPETFYTQPDDPTTVGITPGSGGGDAIALEWAVHPATGAPVNLATADFVRISTAVARVSPFLGEASTEIGGLALVRVPVARPLADITGIGGPPSLPDGLLTGDDFIAFVSAFADAAPLADVCGIGGPPAQPDGLITGDDFVAIIASFAGGGG